jgi:hypothetical protein
MLSPPVHIFTVGLSKSGSDIGGGDDVLLCSVVVNVNQELIK